MNNSKLIKTALFLGCIISSVTSQNVLASDIAKEVSSSASKTEQGLALESESFDKKDPFETYYE